MKYKISREVFNLSKQFITYLVSILVMGWFVDVSKNLAISTFKT
jgi:hypothetical protein